MGKGKCKMNEQLIKLKEDFDRYQRKIIELETRRNSVVKDFDKRRADFKKRLSLLGLESGKDLQSKIDELVSEYEKICKNLESKIGELDGILRNSRNI